jgi:hypothetical protein
MRTFRGHFSIPGSRPVSRYGWLAEISENLFMYVHLDFAKRTIPAQPFFRRSIYYSSL